MLSCANQTASWLAQASWQWFICFLLLLFTLTSPTCVSELSLWSHKSHCHNNTLGRHEICLTGVPTVSHLPHFVSTYCFTKWAKGTWLVNQAGWLPAAVLHKTEECQEISAYITHANCDNLWCTSSCFSTLKHTWLTPELNILISFVQFINF